MFTSCSERKIVLAAHVIRKIQIHKSVICRLRLLCVLRLRSRSVFVMLVSEICLICALRTRVSGLAL